MCNRHIEIIKYLIKRSFIYPTENMHMKDRVTLGSWRLLSCSADSSGTREIAGITESLIHETKGTSQTRARATSAYTAYCYALCKLTSQFTLAQPTRSLGDEKDRSLRTRRDRDVRFLSLLVFCSHTRTLIPPVRDISGMKWRGLISGISEDRYRELSRSLNKSLASPRRRNVSVATIECRNPSALSTLSAYKVHSPCNRTNELQLSAMPTIYT